MTDDQNQPQQQQTMDDLIRSARASGTAQKRQALAERFGFTAPDTTGDEESAGDSEDSA